MFSVTYILLFPYFSFIDSTWNSWSTTNSSFLSTVQGFQAWVYFIGLLWQGKEEWWYKLMDGDECIYACVVEGYGATDFASSPSRMALGWQSGNTLPFGIDPIVPPSHTYIYISTGVWRSMPVLFFSFSFVVCLQSFKLLLLLLGKSSSLSISHISTCIGSRR